MKVSGDGRWTETGTFSEMRFCGGRLDQAKKAYRILLVPTDNGDKWINGLAARVNIYLVPGKALVELEGDRHNQEGSYARWLEVG